MNKENIINYLIDCKGYDLETAEDIYRDYGEDISQVVDINKVIAYSK